MKTAAVLSPRDLKIVRALASILTPQQKVSGKQGPLDIGELAERYVASLPSKLQRLMKLSLRIFEFLPFFFIFKFSAFSSLSPQNQDAYIRKWAGNRLYLIHVTFLGVASLCFLTFYAEHEIGIKIGFDRQWKPEGVS